MSASQSDKILRRLVAWGEDREEVRAMILTSTRAGSRAPSDIFSDYDVILAVKDVRAFEQDAWLEAFGHVLVVYRDPVRLDHGLPCFARITQYEDGLKIDFTVCPVEWLPRVAADPQLPPDLDVGYQVLLDKDRLAGGLKTPSFTAYIPSPPDEAEYHRVIEEFFHEATYVAKHIWREDLMPAKYNLDQMMKQDNLRVMLEWRIEIDHAWSLKPGAYGKGLKKRLSPELWAELESTYVGAGRDENWTALFKTIDLFRKVAIEVGDRLGYAYPHSLDHRVVVYLQKVKGLDPQASALF